jgi:phenylalanyl-tRNA synthetase beta subunit
MNALYSYRWLSSYFTEPLPSVQELVALLTKHSFEVEHTEVLPSGDTLIELSILPNRAHDCLGHFFLAGEIGVLIGKTPRLPVWKKIEQGEGKGILATISDESRCLRYSAEEVQGVTVGPSPAWLVEFLTSVGQRSINNLVDAGNFVTLSVNQPVHVFDKDTLVGNIMVRPAKEGELFETLDGKTLTLDTEVLVIADEVGPVALAGIKGGKRAEVTEETKNIVIESATFNARYVRKTSTRFGIKTDSSRRFEAELSPSLAPLALEMLLSLVAEVAGGVAFSRIDIYPRLVREYKVGLVPTYPEALLGYPLEIERVRETLDRLGFSYREALSLKEVLEMGPRLVGKPYLLGASVTKDAPNTFDCSSLVAYLYSEAGVWLPRMSVDQLVYGDPVEKEAIRPGDLVFSNTGEGKVYTESIECLPGTPLSSGVDHVGLYVGEGRVLHATRSAGGVIVEPLAESIQFKNIVAVRRYISPDEVRLVVTIPPERLDLRLPEDLVEEIGRVVGYDEVPGTLLPSAKTKPEEGVFPVVHMIRTTLREAGFSEVYGYAFAKEGKRTIANPLQSDRPFLRENLSSGVEEKLQSNMSWVDLFGTDSVSLFEVGNIFTETGEALHVALGVISRKKKEVAVLKQHLEQTVALLEKKLGVSFEKNTQAFPGGFLVEINLEPHLAELTKKTWPEENITSVAPKTFSPISPYPYIVRDVSFFLPEALENETLLTRLKEVAGPLCVRAFLFDRFLKEEGGVKTLSLGFRFVFQSPERTLTAEEVEVVFAKVTETLISLGATIR